MKHRLLGALPSREAIAKNRWLRWLGDGLHHHRLWHMSRRGVSLGMALGMFFAFLAPVAQIPLSAAASIALKAILPVAIASTFVTNPFTYVPVYWAAWEVGSSILGQESTTDPFEEPLHATSTAVAPPFLSREWISALPARFAAVGKPLILGLTVFAVSFSALSYLAVNSLWILCVRIKRRRRLAAAAALKASRTAPVA